MCRLSLLSVTAVPTGSTPVRQRVLFLASAPPLFSAVYFILPQVHTTSIQEINYTLSVRNVCQCCA